MVTPNYTKQSNTYTQLPSTPNYQVHTPNYTQLPSTPNYTELHNKIRITKYVIRVPPHQKSEVGKSTTPNTTSTPTTALAVELLTERLLASNEVRHQKFVRILSWKTPAGRSSVGRQAFMRVALPLFPHRAPEEVASAFAEAAAGESGSLGSGAVSIDALAHVLSVMEAEMLL